MLSFNSPEMASSVPPSCINVKHATKKDNESCVRAPRPRRYPFKVVTCECTYYTCSAEVTHVRKY